MRQVQQEPEPMLDLLFESAGAKDYAIFWYLYFDFVYVYVVFEGDEILFRYVEVVRLL